MSSPDPETQTLFETGDARRGSFLDGLNDRQREAVTHEGGHCLVLAGAGSGKTRVLTHRVAWLIAERGVEPRKICAVTFTNKAAGEMRSRVLALLKTLPRQPGSLPAARLQHDLWLSTFHSLGLRLLREWSEGEAAPNIKGLPRRGFAVYDRDAAMSVWRRCQAELRISPRDYDPGRLFNECSRAVNRLEDPASWDGDNKGWERKIAGRVWKKYRRAMEAAGAVDFDDLLHRPLQVLTRDPGLRQRIAARFAHLLVDEYQDTNRLQYRLVQALLGDGALMVVGDEDQSIYRWRGADLNNVLDFQKDFPGAEVVRLEQNYRSSQPILSAAVSLVAHNRERLGKNLWTDRDGGEKPAFVQCATDREEAQWIADKVRELTESATASPRDTFALSDIAVLYRTNAQSRLFEEVFMAERIPHRVVGGPRFFARREIRDVLAYLQLLVRPDDVAFGRAVAAPTRGVGPKTLAALGSIESGLGAAATLETLAAGSDPETALRRAGCAAGAIAGLLSFAHLLAELRELAASAALEHVIRATIERSGYGRLLEAEADGDDRLANLDELIAAADQSVETELDPEPCTLDQLRVFLDRLALLTDGDADRGNADGVRLLTVHAAKGLEFGAVFLAGMEEELFPHMTSIADGQVEEERRLAYVGMTRAERRLFLSAARSRRVHGRDRWQEPSRFIGEIDPRHVIVNDYVNPKAVGSQGYAPSAFSGLGGRTGQRRRSRSGFRGRKSAAPKATRVSFLAGQPTRPAEEADLLEGATVVHPMFGPGEITESTGSGEHQKLKIRFNQAGTKSVLAGFAKLQVPEETN